MQLRPAFTALFAALLLSACTAPAPQPAPDPPKLKDSGEMIATVKAEVPERLDQPWIRSVAFATPEQGWILLGEQALHTQDGGESWHPVTLPKPFESITFITPHEGLATLGEETYRTGDSGESWTLNQTADWPTAHVQFVDEKHGWSLHPEQGELRRTQDGGATWEKFETPCPAFSGPMPFSFVNPQTGWLLCGLEYWQSGAQAKRLYRTPDGGVSWSLIGQVQADPTKPSTEWPQGLPAADIVGSLFFVNEQVGWFTGARYGSLLRTQDGGHSWHAVDAPAIRAGALRFVTPEIGYRFGLDTRQDQPWVVSMTRDGGQTWEQVYPRPTPLHRFYLDTQTYIGELQGALYRSTDAGLTWQRLSNLPAPLLSLSYTSRDEAWALMGSEQEPLLYRSTDGGVTWRGRTTSVDLTRFAYVQGLSEHRAILWDNANRLLVTTDGGSSFSEITAPKDEYGGHGFYFSTPETGWFSRGFQLYKTKDGGVHWEELPLPASWKAQGVTIGPDGRLWASIADVSDEFTPVLLTLASSDGGKSWNRYDLGTFDQPNGIHRCGPESLCIHSGGQNHGIVSHDGGQSWQYYQR